VISGGPDSLSFKLKVYPRWKRENAPYVDIGFHITDAPSTWKKFVQEVMSKNKGEDTCVWEQYSGSLG
jgi:hypothetical protein